MSYSSEILADSPVAYWRLGEASGTSAADSSGNSVTGTYSPNSLGAWSGGTLGATGALAGDADTAATFNGTSGRIDLGTALAQAGDFTVEAWARPTAYGTNSLVCARAKNSGTFEQNWMIFIRTTANVWSFQVNSTGAGNEVRGAAATLNTWAHIVGTYTHTGASNPVLKIYVNGALSATDSSGENAGSTSTLITSIGSYANVSSFFTGSIDEVAIYNTALSATRILAHYNAGIASGFLLSRSRIVNAGGIGSGGSRSRLVNA